MKPARILVIAVAAVAAIGLAFVVRAMGSGEPVSQAEASAPAPRPMARVLVAKRDLQPGHRITEADLDWKEWPVEAVNVAFTTDGSVPVPNPVGAAPAEEAEEAEAGAEAEAEGAVARVARAASQAVGSGAKADFVDAVVREVILAGEPIVARKIVRAGDSGYMAAYLEPGMRAMAIRVNVETAAGGFILPGDRVDVILSREQGGGGEGASARYATATVMQNVKVLAIDQTTRMEGDEQAVVGATATLELTPGDAEILAQAKAEGELSLMLRSYADAAGPSGRVYAGAGQSSAVRVYRGGAPEVVVVQ